MPLVCRAMLPVRLPSAEWLEQKPRFAFAMSLVPLGAASATPLGAATAGGGRSRAGPLLRADDPAQAVDLRGVLPLSAF